MALTPNKGGFMLFVALFTFLFTSAHNGTRNYEECLKEDFKTGACWEAKQMYKAGKWGCTVQGKGFNGSSTCVK